VKQFFGNSPFLIYYTLKNMKLENFNAGAGVPTLNRNHLNGIPIIVPDKEIQKRFDEVVSRLQSRTELLRKANENLIATRDLLLPRLISGKLSVENLDIQFPPSMAEEKE
jgi:type I restriction enzyme S subunit